MTHQERIEFCISRRSDKPDAKIVEWLNDHIDSPYLIGLFLKGDPSDFNYPNDYIHLYQPSTYFSIREEKEDLWFDGGAVFNYSDINDDAKTQISKLVDDEDWEYDCCFYPSLDEKKEQQLQRIRDRIILDGISDLISYYNDLEGRKGYLDMIISIPMSVESFIPIYREILISEFEEKFPEVFLRLSFYVGWDAGAGFDCSFKFVYQSIFIEIDSEKTQFMARIYEDLGINPDDDDE